MRRGVSDIRDGKEDDEKDDVSYDKKGCITWTSIGRCTANICH